jgi:hypothetical protein
MKRFSAVSSMSRVGSAGIRSMSSISEDHIKPVRYICPKRGEQARGV